MNDQQIEQEIQAKWLTAQHVNPEHDADDTGRSDERRHWRE